MLFGKSKEKDVFELFSEHLTLLEKAMGLFEETVNLYLANDDNYIQKSKELHRTEHAADTFKMEIRKNLNEGTFFKGLRRDFAHLITELDDIFGYAVIVGKKLSEEKIVLSKVFSEDMDRIFREIITETAKIGTPLKDAVMSLRKDVSKIEEPCKCVWLFETKVDRLQHRFFKRLFELDIELAHKLQIRDLVLYISNITDKAQNITDLISILAMNTKI